MSGSLTIQGNQAAFTPATIDFEETLAVAKTAVKDVVQVLTLSFVGPQSAEVSGATKLEPPKKLSMDANLQLAELQETLNQLIQKVSVNDIKQNLQTQNDANKKQLETMQEAAKAAAAAAAKAKEADHKKNVWAAVAGWVGAAITAATMVVTLISAVGMLATGNFVSAGALFVATAAMGVQLTCQVALAIDATMKANGNEQGLGIDTEKWTKVMEVAGYVALAASMVGLIGGLVTTASKAGATAAEKVAAKGVEQVGTKVATNLADDAVSKGASELVKDAATNVTDDALKKGASELVEEGAQTAVTKTTEEIAKETAREILKTMRSAMFKVNMLGNIATAGVKVAGKQVELEARKDASELQKEADLKEADVEAMKAMIAKLQGMIQQLQDDLEEQMEKGENVLQSILTPIKDRMTTTETLVQNIGA